MRSLRFHCLLAALLVAACVPVAAQEWSGSGRVTGTVFDEDGQPVAGAQVFYRMVQDRELGPAPFVTNKKGKFSFLGLRGGRWVVRVEAEGFYPWNSPEPVDVYSSGKSDEVDAVLERIPEDELIARARWEANEELQRGDELANQGDHAGARAAYEQAMAELEEADHPVVLASVAATYMNEGDIDQAKATLERALAIDPAHVVSLTNYCAIVASEGKMEEAEAILARIPDATRVHPTTLMNIGLAHFNNGEMAEAIVFFDRAIRDNPEVAQAFYFRGLARLNLGENEGAEADFERFVEAAPDNPQAADAREYLKYLQETPSGG
jgi:tetratricopeptide (TPR) repeat protein